VRKALSHVDTRCLIAYQDTISLEPTALTTDAIVFGDLVGRSGIQSLEEAIALYGGELLEGVQIAAPEFESWITTERERFREMALEAMTKLLDHHLSVGAVERGIRIAAPAAGNRPFAGACPSHADGPLLPTGPAWRRPSPISHLR
jgi:DNA-binding SARP family transcriptional activator